MDHRDHAMKNATLRQLKVFESVARHLNFSRAAEELHLTQPAVSTQVKQLAAHAGLPLFEQLGKKTYLTPAGAELLGHGRAIIEQFREAEEAMARLKGVSGGKLNVAVISAGDYFFPRILAEFMRRHGGVTLNLAVHNREELLRRMADNLTDLAVMVRPPEGADTVSESFAPHPYVIVAAPDHPLARRRRIPIGSIAERTVCRAGTGIGYLERDGAGIRPSPGKTGHRDGNHEHRNDQAGGHRGHGHQLSVGAHD